MLESLEQSSELSSAYVQRDARSREIVASHKFHVLSQQSIIREEMFIYNELTAFSTNEGHNTGREEVMHINADALYSLQVFDSENHASIHSDKTKEGLSLYGILNNTKTALGKNLMRQWLLRPSTSIAVIGSRHDAVACFMRPDNLSTAAVMHSHLKGIKNIPKILSVMSSGKAKASDWQGLVKVGHTF